MSQVLPVLFAGLGAINGIIAAQTLLIAGQINESTAIVFLLMGCIIGFLMWFVSPLPVETGGVMGGKPTPRKWGFTMQPQNNKEQTNR